ncbi:hypothetical protein MTO96_010863 [Rhipicephalus appendiculatus]
MLSSSARRRSPGRLSATLQKKHVSVGQMFPSPEPLFQAASPLQASCASPLAGQRDTCELPFEIPEALLEAQVADVSRGVLWRSFVRTWRSSGRRDPQNLRGTPKKKFEWPFDRPDRLGRSSRAAAGAQLMSAAVASAALAPRSRGSVELRKRARLLPRLALNRRRCCCATRRVARGSSPAY